MKDKIISGLVMATIVIFAMQINNRVVEPAIAKAKATE